MKQFRFKVDPEVAIKFNQFVLEESARRGVRLTQEALFSEWVVAGCPLNKEDARGPIVPGHVAADLAKVAARPAPEKLHRAPRPADDPIPRTAHDP
jgi:hypothetical protein